MLSEKTVNGKDSVASFTDVTNQSKTNGLAVNSVTSSKCVKIESDMVDDVFQLQQMSSQLHHPSPPQPRRATRQSIEFEALQIVERIKKAGREGLTEGEYQLKK